MYVVIAGRLRILTTRYNGGEEIIREIAPGESVGELALLTGNPRSATVRAIRDTLLARFSRDAFENVVRHHPQTFSRLTAQIAGRQSRGNNDNESRCNIRTLVILPLDSRAATQEFIDNLIEVLRPIGPTLHLRSETYRVEGGQVTSLLSELETAHRFLIYEADAELSPWTERCVRQADLRKSGSGSGRHAIAVVAHLSGVAGNHIAATELVLLHAGKFDPTVQLDRWRQTICVNAHHHIVLDGAQNLGKLARRLTGATVGLVLERRRCSRFRPHRCDPRAARIRHSDRLYRRHEYGRRDRGSIRPRLGLANDGASESARSGRAVNRRKITPCRSSR